MKRALTHYLAYLPPNRRSWLLLSPFLPQRLPFEPHLVASTFATSCWHHQVDANRANNPCAGWGRDGKGLIVLKINHKAQLLGKQSENPVFGKFAG
ncbi:hypothetical protein [Aeromonas veronii]|uniref:hypothetical protein n=1 Tax=Aeromonas veronii TaxID=654 RepID=UPI00191E6B04|nr:hypothetical protein [Aeromonas veronii]MBL0594310.1 hypothetical protein [Aeromonas veronii]